MDVLGGENAAAGYCRLVLGAWMPGWWLGGWVRGIGGESVGLVFGAVLSRATCTSSRVLIVRSRMWASQGVVRRMAERRGWGGWCGVVVVL